VVRGLTPGLVAALVAMTLSVALGQIDTAMGFGYLGCAMLSVVTVPALLHFGSRTDAWRERQLNGERYRSLVDLAQGAQDVLAADSGAAIRERLHDVESQIAQLHVRAARWAALDPALVGAWTQPGARP
jgi:ABC-type transport system involved in cytochrome bd biosynthesis fused ATPase/permease subunit